MNKFVRMELGKPADAGYSKVVGYGVTPEGKEFRVICPIINNYLDNPDFIEKELREIVEHWVPGWRPIL